MLEPEEVDAEGGCGHESVADGGSAHSEDEAGPCSSLRR